jgi:hypothetical protein
VIFSAKIFLIENGNKGWGIVKDKMLTPGMDFNKTIQKYNNENLSFYSCSWADEPAHRRKLFTMSIFERGEFTDGANKLRHLGLTRLNCN